MNNKNNKSKGDKDRSNHQSNRSDNNNGYNDTMESEVDLKFQEQVSKMLERYLDQTIQYDTQNYGNNSLKQSTSKHDSRAEAEAGIYLLQSSKQFATYNEFRDTDTPMLLTKRSALPSSSSDSDSDSEDERIRSVAVQFNPMSGGFDSKTANSTKNKR